MERSQRIAEFPNFCLICLLSECSNTTNPSFELRDCWPISSIFRFNREQSAVHAHTHTHTNAICLHWMVCVQLMSSIHRNVRIVVYYGVDASEIVAVVCMATCFIRFKNRLNGKTLDGVGRFFFHVLLRS